MVGPLITLVGLVLAAFALVAASFIVGMRRKSPAVTGSFMNEVSCRASLLRPVGSFEDSSTSTPFVSPSRSSPWR